MTYHVLAMGDAAFTVAFAEPTGAAGARQAAGWARSVGAAAAKGDLPGLIDLSSAGRSLTVRLDPLVISAAEMKAAVTRIIDGTDTAEQAEGGASWLLPACYHPDHGLDLIETAERIDAGLEEVIALHSGREYDVFTIGFLPGFPFMTETPDRLRFPRRASPRTRVPPGSVAVANDQTAIYPWESPGGWHLLARCPVPLFDASQPVPSFLSPGDRVRFRPVDLDELAEIEAGLTEGRLRPGDFAANAGEDS